MKIGDGPAAVTGDERCTTVTDQRLGRRSGRMNQESEYLPETTQPLSVDQREGVDTRIHQGIPGSFFMIRGFFLSFREAESKTTGGRTHSSAPLAEVHFSSEERLRRLARNFRQVMGHIPSPCPVCHAVYCLPAVSCTVSTLCPAESLLFSAAGFSELVLAAVASAGRLRERCGVVVARPCNSMSTTSFHGKQAGKIFGRPHLPTETKGGKT